MDRAVRWLRNVLTPNIVLYQFAYLATSHFAQILGLRFLSEFQGFRLPFFTLAIYSVPGFILALIMLVYRHTGRVRHSPHDLYSFGSRDLSLGGSANDRNMFSVADYALLSIPSVIAQLLMVWAVTRPELSLLNIIFLLQLDTCFLAICNAARPIVTRELSRFIYLVATAIGIGSGLAMFISTESGYVTPSTTAYYSFYQGMAGLALARITHTIRGSVVHHWVIKRGAGRGGAGDALDRAEALHNRHLGSDAEYDTERLSSLDRIFGCGLYSATMCGVNLRASVELHVWGQFLALCPCAFGMSFIAYITGLPDASDVGTAFLHWYDGLATIVVFAILAAAYTAEPVITSVVTFKSGVFWWCVRHLGATATLTGLAIFLFHDEYNSSMSIGYFVFVVGFIAFVVLQYAAWQRRLANAVKETTAAPATIADGEKAKGGGHVLVQRIGVSAAGNSGWTTGSFDSVLTSGGNNEAARKAPNGSSALSIVGAAVTSTRNVVPRCVECGLTGTRHYQLLGCNTCRRLFHVPCYKQKLPPPIAAPTPAAGANAIAATAHESGSRHHIARCLYDPALPAVASATTSGGGGGSGSAAGDDSAEDLLPLLDLFDGHDADREARDAK